jgi:beta-phosphoglucomutase family hydrolase
MIDPPPIDIPSIDIPSSVEALIFDCDGTLTDSMPAHYAAWVETLARYSLVFAEERFYALGGVPSDKIVRLLGDEHGSPFDDARACGIACEKEDAFLRNIALLQPVAAVVAVVRSNKGVRKMAVASGGNRHVIGLQLRHIGLTDHFDAIVTSEDTTRHKPDPDVFLEAARRLGAAPQNCLIFEDAAPGIEAARRAAIPCIDVRPYYERNRLRGGAAQATKS